MQKEHNKQNERDTEKHTYVDREKECVRERDIANQG